MALSCEEIHEQITAYVDDRIDEEEYRRDVERHIEACPSCRSAFEEEVAVKMVLRKRYAHAPTPDTTRRTVEESIEALAKATPSKARTSSTRRTSGGSKFPVLALLVVVTLLGGYIILFEGSDDPPKVEPEETTQRESVPRTQQITRSNRPSTGPANLFNLALASAGKVESGAVTAQYPTSDFGELVKTFLDAGVESIGFAGASLPLEGGFIDDKDGMKLPQFIYRQGDNLLYVIDIPWSTIQSGKPVYVTPDITEKLSAGEQVWQRPELNSNLVMYKKGDAVITAVSGAGPNPMRSWLGLPASGN